MLNVATLKKGEKGTIENFDVEQIPLKLIEMGCLPGNIVEVVQIAPFQDPIYIKVNDSYVAIRQETAALIEITKLD